MGGKLWITTSVAALLWCGAAQAQAQQTPQPASAEAQDTQLEEVVVTAERRTTNLQSTAIAADVLSGQELADRGVTRLDALQFATPSLTVQNSGQGNSLNIRGIGKTENSSSVGVGVITYRDGVAVFPAYMQNEPYFDLQSVEVLRGPQGTFAGQNATGGAVFITQRRPTFTDVNGYVQLQYGNYNDIGVQAAINLPISDTLAARVAFNHEERDSFYNVIAGSPSNGGEPGAQNYDSVRGSLLWNPTENLSVLFSTDYSYLDFGGYPTSPTFSTDDLFDIRVNGPYAAHDETVRSVLNASYVFDSGITLRSITGYQWGVTNIQADSDGTNVGTSYALVDANQTLWSQEFNILSRDDQRLRWVAGAYYQSDLIRFPPGRFVGFNGLFALTLEGRNPKTTSAVFGQVSYDLTDSLELQVGARYAESTVVNDATSAIPAFGLSISQNDRVEEDAITGKIALNWQMNEDNFLYAFVARGNKAGGINGVNTSFVPPSLFEAEEVTDYEIGWKADWFGGRLRTQLGGYYNIYNNFQIVLGDPVFTSINEIINVTGDTEIYGVEASAQGRFGALGFDVGLSLSHSELPDYFAADTRRPRTGPCDPATGPASGNCVNVGGNAQTYAPEMTFHVGVEYDFAIGEGTLTPRIDYSHIADSYTTIFANDAFGDHLESRDLINAQLTYEQDDWRLQAYSTNLADEQYIGSIKAGQRYAGPPRQYGVRLTRTF